MVERELGMEGVHLLIETLGYSYGVWRRVEWSP